jgi:hypothetical protein
VRLGVRPAATGSAAAIVLVLLALGGAVAPQGSARTSSAPTPISPVYGGIPGALPPGFAYVYNDVFRGWPVRPLSIEHPVRGSFLDPRGPDDDAMSGYHFGVDVNVDDQHPDPRAPKGLTHAVYALDAGVVSEPVADLKRRCGNRRLDAGHFAYWHVSPLVHPGQYVRAGQQIGWTCLGDWHVHISEWQFFRRARVWVNPLHVGGRVVPYVDTLPPVVSPLVFVTPPARPWQPKTGLAQPDTSTVLRAAALHGKVEVRAQIGDPQSFLGFLAQNPAWPTEFTPYRVTVDVRDARTGKSVLSRVSFQADQLPQTPYLVHYAPGTVEADNMLECVGPPQLAACAGTYWFRPFSRFRQEYWDTRKVANGPYRVTVRGYDLAGNVGSQTAAVTVRN